MRVTLALARWANRELAGAPAKETEAAPSTGGQASPLDQIRKQGAVKPEAASAPPAEPAAPPAAAAPSKPAPADTAGLSPLELIRRQGAAKR